MTISFKTGAFTSRSTTGTDVITGVGFQPKVILFFSSSDFATDDTFAADYNFRFGVAVDTTAANQKSMCSTSFDTADPSSSERTFTSASIHLRSVGGATVKGAISAIGSDGFTVNWTLMDGATHRISWICIGGTDITNTKVGGLTMPATSQSQATTGVGFQADFLMFWGNNLTGDDVSLAGSSWGIGFATSTGSQLAISNASQDSQATMITKRYQRSDNSICYAALSPLSPTTTSLSGVLTAIGTDGFTINWTIAAGGPSSKLGYLAIKGGTWKIGAATAPTSATTKAVSGIGVQPVGVILASACATSSTSAGANARISFGGGSSSSNNRCIWAGDTDAAAADVSASIEKSAKCISIITENATHTSSTVNAEASVSTLDSTGFTLNWSTASASAYEFLYIAVGTSGGAPQNITKSLTETVTLTGTVARTVTAAPRNITKTLTETTTITDSVARTVTHPGTPTKLYFHAANTAVAGTLPTTNQSALTADFTADALTAKRSMTITKGTSAINVSRAADTTHNGVAKNYFWTRFISPLLNQNSISANTWTYAFAYNQDNNANNFPVAGSSQPVRVNCYVWKPSNGTKIGTILDGNTASTTIETSPGANPVGEVTTFSGSAVSGFSAQDAVLVFEAWFVLTPVATGSGNNYFAIDGTTDVTDFTAVISAASYLQTPETLAFFVAGNAITKSLTETVTIGQPTPAIQRKKIRTASESVALPATLDTLVLVGGHKRITKSLSEFLTLQPSTVSYVATTRKDLVRTLVETLRISDSVNFTGKTKHTGDPGYWLPLKPRIKIYAFTDSTYSAPLYSYDAFLDSGTVDKPIGLQFESTSTTAGTFSIQIDNSADTYDLDMFSRGNRVTIECSKDGSVWSSAFHGLVRSAKQKVFGPNNRIIYIEGFSYLIRLNERILSVKKQAALIGASYDRTDTSMFSDNLINDLLTNDADYVKTVDDTQLYSVFKTSNITASPIDDWVPRLDVQLTSVDQAINSVLEFSQSFLTVDVSNDQIVLFNPDRVPSGGANAFLVTDNLVLQGDSSLNTMYPTSDYTYEISYDFADSANRLISAIGNVECPQQTIPGAAGNVGSVLYSNVPDTTASVGAVIYDVFSPSDYLAVGPGSSPATGQAGMYLQAGAAEIGKVIGQIDIVLTCGAATPAPTGTIQIGIWKASDSSFVQIGTKDASSVPTGGAYYGYGFSNTANTYVCQAGDVIGVDCSALNKAIGVAFTVGTSSTHTPVYYSGGWTQGILSGYAWTGRTYELDISSTSIKLNGSTVQRVAILINAGNPMVGINIGRISLTMRRGTTALNNTLQVGIRKADNTYIYFGGGVFAGSSFPSTGTSWAIYDYDKLDNHYQMAVGDRITIETNSSTGGYIEMQCSVDSPGYQTVQTWTGSAWTTSGIVGYNLGVTINKSNAQPDIIIDPCGGLPETRDADPLLTIASDCNMAKRIGMVEQMISNIPPHVKTFQTMMEYMFNKLYIMARPRFTFDYPSVTLPGVMPKSGDICAHISKKAGIGVRRGVVQTGVITQVTYDFGQDSDSILGLRRLSLQTSGILRGSY